MLKFLVFNDFNDINSINILHFSLDKGHFLAKSLAKNGNNVYFATSKDNYQQNGLYYINFNKITKEFLDTIDYVIIVREPIIVPLMVRVPAIKEKMAIPKKDRIKPKFIIKSDAPNWFESKDFINGLNAVLKIGKIRGPVRRWVAAHIDFVCAQNEDFCNYATRYIPRQSILISDMGISPEPVEYGKLINPYTINHSYCVDSAAKLTFYKALMPLYYVKNPNHMAEFNTKKYIIIYTGRLKTDNGKIWFNMSNIMRLLGDEYELHIFPGSFYLMLNGKVTTHSGKNANSLDLVRNLAFKDNKNVIIHHPYEHKDKYKYLYFADCGIDFAHNRPRPGKSLEGNAKILEYCEVGLPVVCEEHINNLRLVRTGQNGIILPYMASDEEYAKAIKTIIHEKKIDRQFCQKITVENENWDRKAAELVEQLKKQQSNVLISSK